MFSNQSEKMKKTVSNSSVLFFIVITTTFFGYVSGRSGLHSEQSAPPARIQQCREGCLEKVHFFLFNSKKNLNLWNTKKIRF